jgi:serine/threonine-protein kinase RsbT
LQPRELEGATVASEAIAVTIARDGDIIIARTNGRELASQIGFSRSDLTLIAAATSEIARNIYIYAGRGVMTFCRVHEGSRLGIVIVGRDCGPGIADIDKAMQDGFSTGQSLGLGLPGARRIMDDFAIVSEVGKGTTVTMKKWLK